MANSYKGPGYKGYYGRRTGGARAVLKWIIVFLLAVLVVSVGVFYLLREGLVFDSDGAHVVLPWDREESPSPESSSSSPIPSEEPSDSPLVIEPDPEPTLRDLARETLQAVEVTQTVLLSGRAAEQAQAAGGNAVLVTMKNDDGTLNYISSVALAVSAGSSGSDALVNQALRELIDGDIYTVAQVSCFRDGLLGGDGRYALLTNSGYRWRDFAGVYWTCAANGEVQAYLTEICVELAQMGFDEILLTNCGYPANGSGELGWIRRGDAYPAGALDGVVDGFLARVKAALEPYDVRLSVQGSGSELMGETASTGLAQAGAVANCDHVWVEAADAENYARFAAAGTPGANGLHEKLVVFSAAPGGTDEAWAVIGG